MTLLQLLIVNWCNVNVLLPLGQDCLGIEWQCYGRDEASINPHAMRLPGKISSQIFHRVQLNLPVTLPHWTVIEEDASANKSHFAGSFCILHLIDTLVEPQAPSISFQVEQSDL